MGEAPLISQAVPELPAHRPGRGPGPKLLEPVRLPAGPLLPEERRVRPPAEVDGRHRQLAALRVMGLSCLVLSSSSIAAVFAGLLPSGHSIIPILIVTAGGLLAVAVGEARAGMFGSAWCLGGFGGFNATWALLQLGMWHGWYGIPEDEVGRMMEVYLACWTLLFLVGAYGVRHADRVLTGMLLLGTLGLALDFASYATSAVSLCLHLAALPVLCIAIVSLVVVAKLVRADTFDADEEGALRR